MGFSGAWGQWKPAYLVFFIYGLGFQQEVRVADHDHHVLELRVRGKGPGPQETASPRPKIKIKRASD